MSNRTAILLPGQGTPMEGARDEVARVRPDLLETVIDVVGEDPFPRVADSTRFAQPALVCASIARWTALRDAGLEADAVLGHSIGELAALAVAGVLDERAALGLAAARATAMEVAADLEPGSMAALRKGTLEQASALAEAHGLVVACDNAPGQVVIAGSVAGLEAAEEAAKADGLRLRRLAVTGAFHSPLMAPAADDFAQAIARTDFEAGTLEVFSAVTAAPMDDPGLRLSDGLQRPVLFRRALLALYEAGVRRFVDVGPADVAAGLARRTFADHEDVVVEVPELAAASAPAPAGQEG